MRLNQKDSNRTFQYKSLTNCVTVMLAIFYMFMILYLVHKEADDPSSSLSMPIKAKHLLYFSSLCS